MKQKISRLVFLYKADSGKWNALVDSTRKLLKLQGCTLCSITHGLFGEKAEWQSCRRELGVPIDMFHRDELQSNMQHFADSLPTVLAETESGKLVQLLTAETLDRCRGSVADLRGKIQYHAAAKDLILPTASKLKASGTEG